MFKPPSCLKEKIKDELEALKWVWRAENVYNVLIEKLKMIMRTSWALLLLQNV